MILMMFALILGLLVVVLAFFAEKMSLENSAKKILREQEAIYKGAHEYVAADWRTFSGLDMKFYDQATEALQAKGFTLLGDVENVTLTKTFPWGRTMIRALASPDKVTVVGIYYLNPRGVFGLFMKLILRLKAQGYLEFETEVRNLWLVKDQAEQTVEEERSFFLGTTNAMLASKIKLPPEFRIQFFQPNTPLNELWITHQERVERLKESIRDKTGHRLTEFHSQKDTLDMQNRAEELKAKFRQQSGMVSREELRNLSPNQEHADQMYEAIRTEQSRRRGKDPSEEKME